MLAVREFVGETLGIFLMCFFGLGIALANSVLGSDLGLFQSAMVWSVAISLGVYAARGLSNAHLNPAVSFGMCVAGKMPWRKLPLYLAGQCAGTLIATLLLYALFAVPLASLSGDIEAIEKVGISWCNQYTGGNALPLDVLAAALAEGIGLLVITLVIFTQVENANAGKPGSALWPAFVGATFGGVICVIAPMTGASINPARDIVPRAVAELFGFATPNALSADVWAAYVLAPIAGSIAAALLWRFLLEPLYQRANEERPAALSERKEQ